MASRSIAARFQCTFGVISSITGNKARTRTLAAVSAEQVLGPHSTATSSASRGTESCQFARRGGGGTFLPAHAPSHDDAASSCTERSASPGSCTSLASHTLPRASIIPVAARPCGAVSSLLRGRSASACGRCRERLRTATAGSGAQREPCRETCRHAPKRRGLRHEGRHHGSAALAHGSAAAEDMVSDPP